MFRIFMLITLSLALSASANANLLEKIQGEIKAAGKLPKKVRKGAKQAKEAIDGERKRFERSCGFEIPVQFHFLPMLKYSKKQMGGREQDGAISTAGDICVGVVYELRQSFCKDEEDKDDLKALKTVVCQPDISVGDAYKVENKDGVLLVRHHPFNIGDTGKNSDAIESAF